MNRTFGFDDQDYKKLYLEHAYPSMFAFCVERFGMSEAIAAKRIRGGRAAGRFPFVFGNG